MNLPNPNNFQEGFALKVLENGVYSYYVADKDERVGIYLPVFATGAAKSLIFSFAFDDTLIAGDRVHVDEDVNVVGQIANEDIYSRRGVPYTDVNGKLNKARFKLINYVNPSWAFTVEGGEAVDFDRHFGDSKNAPAVLLGNVNRGGNYKEYSNVEIPIFKDLAERIGVTKQLQLLGYKRTIIVGNEWARLSNLIIDLPGPNLYLYVSDEFYHMNEDVKIKQTAIQSGSMLNVSELVDNKLKIIGNGLIAINGRKSWAIGDSSRNLWLAVNQFTNDYIDVLSFKGLKKPKNMISNVVQN
jgi:hypothetical protein